MALSFLLFHALFFQSPQTFSGLEIYTPLKSGDVCLMTNGNLMLLDKKESQLFLIDSTTQKRIKVAGKGQGPGELQFPMNLIPGANGVWVWSVNGYSEFSPAGKFLGSMNTPDRQAFFKVTSQGWMGVEWNEHRIFLAKADLAEGDLLFEWKESRIFPETRVPGTYYPVWEHISVLSNPDAPFVFLVHTGYSLKITKLNVKDRTHVELTYPEVKAIAFNKDWGKQQFEERFKPGTAKLADLDYFPLVKKAWLAPGQKIVLELWTATPDNTQQFKVLDYDGKEASLGFDPRHMERLLAFNETTAYLSVFNEDEEASIVACPLGQIEATAKATPWIIPESKADGFVSL